MTRRTLTPAEVREVRRRYRVYREAKERHSPKRIARDLEVSVTAVWDVVHGVSHARVR